MNPDTVSHLSHPYKKEKTRSVTYRLPVSLVKEIEAEAHNNNISHNVMARQILERYVQWDRYISKIGIIPVPKKIIDTLGINITAEDIHEIINVVKPVIKDAALLMRGRYDLINCINTLEGYMRASGMNSDHKVDGSTHLFIIQHDLGSNWSLFAQQLLKEILHDFMPDASIEFEITEGMVIASVPLGEDPAVRLKF